jgi:hypothetical protein
MRVCHFATRARSPENLAHAEPRPNLVSVRSGRSMHCLCAKFGSARALWVVSRTRNDPMRTKRPKLADDPTAQLGWTVSPYTAFITGVRLGPRRREWPPSTPMHWPVIHALSGPRRKRTRDATSSSSPTRPSGI